MKKYKFEYYYSNKSVPYRLNELSNQDITKRCLFWDSGTRMGENLIKNGKVHGMLKKWAYSSRNYEFRNFKKDKIKGIEINFEL